MPQKVKAVKKNPAAFEKKLYREQLLHGIHVAGLRLPCNQRLGSLGSRISGLAMAMKPMPSSTLQLSKRKSRAVNRVDQNPVQSIPFKL